MTSSLESHRLEVRRVIARTPDAVFTAWTTPAIMEQWISEPGTRVTVADLKVGGTYHIDMMYHGKSYPHHGEYLVIDRPRRLQFTWISEGTQGRTTVVTVDFAPKGSGTEVVLVHEGIPTDASRADHEQGWTEILGWLSEKI